MQTVQQPLHKIIKGIPSYEHYLLRWSVSPISTLVLIRVKGKVP